MGDTATGSWGSRELGIHIAKEKMNVAKAKVEVGILYKVEGPIERVLPNDGKKFSLAELQGFVGGYIEIVQMARGNGHATLYANEEGKILGLLKNYNASRLMSPEHMEGDYIAGNAILVQKEAR